MINVIVFIGGLGNQMFEYAFYLSYKKRHPFSLYLFDISLANYRHNGFELFDIFSIKGKSRWIGFRILRRIFKFGYKHFKKIEQQNVFKYDPKYLENQGRLTILQGFWQTEKWFDGISDTIRKKFEFNENLLSFQTKTFVQTMRLKASQGIQLCAIHVRRGDYLILPEFKVMSLDYYKDGMRIIESKCKSPIHYVIFSNDIAWCKQNMPLENVSFVDWNTSKNSWQDMYLMSLCHHIIIANSTFSWWGAWLNANPEKIVIAPKQWLDWAHDDIIPDTWITI